MHKRQQTKVKQMTIQQGYELAIRMNNVQAAKKFKKMMNAELAPLETLCSSLLVATASDYAALDELVQDCSNTDIWGHAL